MSDVRAPRASGLTWLSLLGAGCFAALLTTNLSTLPGLHGDEAWFGLRAAQLLHGAEVSFHGMNGYSGALFPWLVSASFRVFGVSVGSLRAVGVLANVAALALLLLMAARLYQRWQSVVVLWLLLASSVLVTAESRLAWEVTALNPLLAALLLLLAVSCLEREPAAISSRRATPLVLAYLLLSVLGTYSHLIFLSLSTALLGASLLCALRYDERNVRDLFTLNALSFVNVVVLAVLKLALFACVAAMPLSLGVFGAFSVALGWQAFALPTWQRRYDERLRAGLLSWHAPIVKGCAALVLVGLLAFAGVHLLSLLQTLSNDALLKRLYSVTLPLPLLVFSYVYVGCIVSVYMAVLLRAARGALQLRSAEYFLLVLPLLTLAVLPLLVRSHSIRYYILANLTLMLALVVAHAHSSVRRRKQLSCLLVAYTLAINAVLLPITLDPRHYEQVAPMHFALGYGRETSAHFFPVASLLSRLRQDHVQDIQTRDAFFIGHPLELYRLVDAWPTLPGRVAVVDYDYEQLGGFSYRLADTRDAAARTPANIARPR